MPFAGAYRYRDWVIKSFNADIPYDRFVTMQLAGDRLPFKSQSERDENLTATTYLGAGPWVWDQAEPVQGRADERNERGCCDARPAWSHRGLRALSQSQI
jgi:hypothetical protein